MVSIKKSLIGILCCYVHIAGAFGFHPDTEIARAAQNPMARNPEAQYYSLLFENALEPQYGSKARTRDILYIKPIIPFEVNDTYDIITRTIIPLYHQANTDPGGGYVNGLGDIDFTFFFTPSEYRSWVWGVGPSVYAPTSTNEALSSGAWSAGPQLIVESMPGPWVVGMLASNVWAFKSQPNVDTANQLSVEYFVSYNFDEGWYITSQPTITANWEVVGNDVWTVPLGFGFGRAFHIGHQAGNASVQAYYNIVRPATIGPSWMIQFNLSFLYARKQN